MNDTKQKTRDVLREITDWLFRWLGTACIVYVALFSIRGCGGYGMDDTDTDSWNRSGVIVRTDAKTGVQYLETAGGAITPRLNADGTLHVTQSTTKAGEP